MERHRLLVGGLGGKRSRGRRFPGLRGRRPCDLGGAFARHASRRVRVPTVRDVVEQVIKDRSTSWRSKTTEQVWRNLFESFVFPVIGDRVVNDVTLDDCRQIVAPFWKGRGSKGYVLRQRLDSVMQYAVAHKCRQDNPAADLKVLLPKVKREPDHHPYLPHKRVADAVRTVWAADDVDEAVRLLLVFIVLTACRFKTATAPADGCSHGIPTNGAGNRSCNRTNNPFLPEAPAYR